MAEDAAPSDRSRRDHTPGGGGCVTPKAGGNRHARAHTARSRLILAPVIAIVAGTFLAQAHAWYWPHELHGLLNEAWLLVTCTALAVLIAVSLRRMFHGMNDWGRNAAIALACLYLGATLAELRVEFPLEIRLGPRAGYLYAADGCEFAVRFPRRPQESLMRVGLADGVVMATVATERDVGSASYFRAECVAFAAPLMPAERAALLASAPDQAARWASSGSIVVERISSDGSSESIVALHGRVEMVDEFNRPRVAQVRARVLIGDRSMLTLIVSELGVGDTLGTQANAFLLSAERR